MSPAVPASVTRAQLTIMEPPSTVGAQPGGTLAQLRLQFNPATLVLRKTTEWRRTPSRMAGESALPEFVGSGPRSLSLDVFLDSTATHDNSVERAVEQLMTACVPTPASLARKTPASPWIRLDWGTLKTTSFNGVLTGLSVTYSLFDVDGKPLRAVCSLTIDEASVDPAGQNPTSGSPEARSTHRVIAGDSLPLLAWRAYGDATAWRTIAEANDIDDPLALIPGAELIVPGIEELTQSGRTPSGSAQGVRP
ncbi:LysM peptidoglycan-binding domain-containing protein [Kitasatospora xanthocidica]|uniref:LysM peptidoglycan-binding domain-containing protein n=1 Tax=Kitasatospora xanthocidica TaxID=83382 RepID=A0A372ZNT2_9ACTN|nr:LysM peptidoglycan-binding domain-containing protein [Kitasatospora xanthocidica]RGD57122.1 LysM peptidoglycan-binding domain-containing protein [Kitasatospora xanthocidica]